MKKKSLFSLICLFFFLFLARGGWLPTDVRLDTGDTPGAGRSEYPQVSSSGSNVYVVWVDDRNGKYDIYFNYSIDGGAAWQATDMRLDTGDPPGANDSYGPKISCNGDNVYVVWTDHRNGEGDIYFNYSIDSGATWQASDIRLDTGDAAGASNSYFNQISSSDDNVYVVWSDHRNGTHEEDYDIHFNYSTDRGANWQTSDIQLNTGVPPNTGLLWRSQVSSSGSNVYVVWEDGHQNNIYFNYSTNGGGSWLSNEIQIDNDDPPNISIDPQLSSSGSNVYVVWYDYRNGWSDIYFNYSTDGGATWQASDTRLDTGDLPGANVSSQPQVSSNVDNVYVVWMDMRNGADDIYFNYSTDGGVTWQATDIRLDTGDMPGTNHSWWPQIISSGSNIFVVWQDKRYGKFDIYLNYSTDGGATWQASDVRLDTGDTAGANHSGYSKISSNGSNVYVVWQDERNGKFDIYFNTGALPAPDIKANGSDGPITITQGDALSVTIDFDAGIQTGEDADWWVLMKTSDPKPNNWYYFDMPTRTWMLGRAPTRQGSLFDVSDKKVPKTSGLAAGTYTFYFAVDTAMNGSIDVSQAYYDKVKVTINP